MSLRLPTASVVALLGPAPVRAAVCAALDEDSARCAGGHARGVVHVTADPGDSLQGRLDALRASAAPVVLVQRVTEGLTAVERRTTFAALRALAGAGCTVVVDDADPVAVLAAADAALRVTAEGTVLLESMPDADALQLLLS